MKIFIVMDIRIDFGLVEQFQVLHKISYFTVHLPSMANLLF